MILAMTVSMPHVLIQTIGYVITPTIMAIRQHLWQPQSLQVLINILIPIAQVTKMTLIESVMDTWHALVKLILLLPKLTDVVIIMPKLLNISILLSLIHISEPTRLGM